MTYELPPLRFGYHEPEPYFTEVMVRHHLLCIPKILSALMRWQNRLSWRNDWVALSISCFRVSVVR